MSNSPRDDEAFTATAAYLIEVFDLLRILFVHLDLNAQAMQATLQVLTRDPSDTADYLRALDVAAQASPVSVEARRLLARIEGSLADLRAVVKGDPSFPETS